jgi:hypothetical protein
LALFSGLPGVPMMNLVIAAANVVPLVFAGVVLVTFLILMVDLSTGRKRREARAQAPVKPQQGRRRPGSYEAPPSRAPYRY